MYSYNNNNNYTNAEHQWGEPESAGQYERIVLKMLYDVNHEVIKK